MKDMLSWLIMGGYFGLFFLMAFAGKHLIYFNTFLIALTLASFALVGLMKWLVGQG